MNKAAISIALIAILPVWGYCQDVVSEDVDTLDAYTRENPDMGKGEESILEMPYRQAEDYSAYPFLHVKDNHINLNGADWDALRGRFAAWADTVISIVHIGDSHIQAEGSTSRTRSLLQQHYGSAGRGLIIPFKLAGTNEARDYAIKTESEFETAKLLRMPWPIEMGFTGIALQPKSATFDFTIALLPKDGSEPDFDFVRIFTHGKAPRVVSAEMPDGKNALFSDYVSGDTITLFLFEPTDQIKLNFESRGTCQIFGFQLENQMTGVEYSAIGNNGATYSSYIQLGTMGRDLRALSPNLVIISLGANEAFGKISDEAFYNNIDLLVKDIQRENPQAEILLVTPSECQRSKTTRNRKGRRTKTYSVNANIPRLRNVILKYGRDHHIATYDWYEVAGGAGSSDHWLQKSLMNTDRIHNTWAGYSLQGSLMYDALIDVIEQR